MKKSILMLVFSSLISCASAQPIPTASYVDVEQYVGKWYAITSLPQFFTRDCQGQTADYAIKTSNSISVVNTCLKKDGTTKDIKGQAEIINPKTNAELIVTFNNFWTRLFRVKGDYNIIKIESDYSTVLVGSRDRKSLWILARTPTIRDEIKKEYISYAKKIGFDTSKLVDSKF